MSAPSPQGGRLTGLLFAAAAAAIMAGALLRPAYNWDLVGYTGAALAASESDAAALHERTYAVIRASVPPAAYALLTDSTQEYRRRTASEPAFFAAQLPFYEVRPLYVLLLRLLFAAGAGPAAATLLLSAIGAAIAAWSAWLFTSRVARRTLRLAACVLMIPAAGIAEVAGLSTPDALSAGLVLAAWYRIFERGGSPALLLPSLLVRADNLLLLAATILALRFIAPAESRISGRAFLVTAAAGIVLYLGITLAWGTHDLRSALPMAMIGRPGGAPFPGAIGEAAAGYAAALRGSAASVLSGYAAYPLFLLCALIPSAAAIRNGRTFEPAVVAAAGMIIRFAVFPVIANRFYTPCFLLASAALVVFAAGPVDRQREFPHISQ